MSATHYALTDIEKQAMRDRLVGLRAQLDMYERWLDTGDASGTHQLFIDRVDGIEETATVMTKSYLHHAQCEGCESYETSVFEGVACCPEHAPKDDEHRRMLRESSTHNARFLKSHKPLFL